MDIIELTRQIGRELQKSQEYLHYQVTMQAADEDTDLQGMIGEFNLKKLAINNEAQKPDRDLDKLQKLNEEMRAIYGDIMQNEKMAAFNESKKELDNLVKRVQTIITLCAEGEDPETADYDPSSCAGDCSSCGGCH